MKNRILAIMFLIMTSVLSNAQDGPGGLGTSVGDTTGSGGNGVQDVSGGSGTNGGSVGAEAPIDGGVMILFAIGIAYTGVTLAKRKKSLVA